MRSAELAELERYRAALLHVALRLCHGHADDARDLVQETFRRAIENAHLLPESRRLRAWLLTVQMNLFFDRYRRERRAPRSPLLDHHQLAIAEDEDEPEPEWEQVTLDEVRAALAGIDERLRRVFELFEFERRSYKEIALAQGIPVNTVAGMLHRARQRLRAALVAPQGGEASAGKGVG